LSSKEIMDGLNFVKDVLIKPYFAEEGEGRRLRYVIEMKDNFLQGSTLITSLKEQDLLKEYMGTSYIVTELIYRATKDGFQSSIFHSKVDGKGSVICIVKSKTGQVFGGFTNLGFNSSSSYQVDSKAFLFHITKKCKMEQTANTTYAVYGGSGYHVTFGGGHDLYLCDNANTTNSSYTNLGHTYKCPNGITYGSTEAQNYLAGTYNFMVDEVEVFKVVVNE